VESTASFSYLIRTLSGLDIRLPLFLGIVILYILFSIDIVTTEAILRLGGVELNRLMTEIVSYPMGHIALKGAVLTLVAGVCVWAEERIARSGIATMAIIIAFYMVVALHNSETLYLMMTGAV
jgi:hypothetical protein